MTTAKVTSRQSLFDVAVQHCGTWEAALDLALLAGISLTDDLTVGDTLTLTEPADTQTVQTFAVNRYEPATACTNTDILTILDQQEGIDFWGIEFDFVVS